MHKEKRRSTKVLSKVDKTQYNSIQLHHMLIPLCFRVDAVINGRRHAVVGGPACNRDQTRYKAIETAHWTGKPADWITRRLVWLRLILSGVSMYTGYQ